MADKIESNSRQMPSASSMIKEKDYCDLLYAWIQCNSDRVSPNSRERYIDKSKIKWMAIERAFTRILVDGTEEKVMGRKTIAKYFKYLEDNHFVELVDDRYLITLLSDSEANLIELRTLAKLMNTLQKNSLNIYIYLYNRFYANGQNAFIATIKQIKDFIGIASTTTCNNIAVDDTLDILKRLKLLDFHLKTAEDDSNKTYLEFLWVKNKLP